MTEIRAAGEPSALKEPVTRLRLAAYVARAVGILLAAVPLLLVADACFTDAGDPRPGVPELVPIALAGAALMAILVGICSLVCSVLMTCVLAREPWRQVSARYELVESRAENGNGNPVLHLSGSQHHWTLTLAALVWRWPRFGSQKELLLAARPGRGGVVATVDKGAIAWAGGPRLTAIMLRRRGKGRVRTDPPTRPPG